MMTTELQTRENAEQIEARLAMRSKIIGFETALAEMPNATRGDRPDCPLKHSFADGMYVREIFLPKGTVLTGKIHRHSHPNFLMSGKVLVATEGGGVEVLTGPCAMISEAGTKRAVVVLEDTVWVTVHLVPNGVTDLDEIEKMVIAPSYEDLMNERLLCPG